MKNIGIITTCRADYGILENLYNLLKNNKKINTNLLVSGSHFSRKYGTTIKEIKKNNKDISIISKNINIKNYNSIITNISKDLEKYKKSIKKLDLDFIVVLGDRFEILAPVICSFFMNIPLIHIHGGEKTYGSNDDIIRHVVSKFSHYHFVAHKEYQKRLIQLGENKNNIFISGGLGPDNILKTKFLTKKEIEKKLRIKLKKNIFLVTCHPETNKGKDNKHLINEILISLKYINETTIIFTAPNSDIYSEYFISKIEKFVKINKNSYFYRSLGKQLFFSLLKNSNLMIGNSSSGIIEGPTLKIPTINIGDRQKGRLFSSNIINAKADNKLINNAIRKAKSNNFKHKMKKLKNVYEKKDTNLFIYKKILNLLNLHIRKKEFIDLL